MEQILDQRRNRYWLLSIPKDGDCLFGSLVHQLYGITPKNALFKPYSKQLREIAVREMRNRRDKYYNHLSIYADELVHGDLPLVEKIEEYLRMLETPGFWGGAECISSLADYFKVSVEVYQDNASITFSPDDGGDTDPRTLQIFYRGTDDARNHYDSIVCIRPYDYTLLTPTPNNLLETVYLADRDFVVECTTMLSEQDYLITSVGHQLTGAEINEDTVAMLRCMIADEIHLLPTSVLASLGIPESGDDLDTYLFHLKTGRHTVGRDFLILLSSLMGINIYLHSTNQPTVRLAPIDRGGTVTINLLENHDHFQVRYASVLKVKRNRLRTSADLQDDTLMVAEKVARVEIDATPEICVPSAPLDPSTGVRFASLNVNGCMGVEKRNMIDLYLLSKSVHIAVLQEVNVPGSEVMTSHYRWYLSEKSGSRKRGLALLVRIGANITVDRRKTQGSNIELAEISYQIGEAVDHLLIVNVHGPNANSSKFFAGLGSLVGGLKDPRRLVVAGDFNSQLGSNTLTTDEQCLIGKFVGHDQFNENGQQMRFFLNLHSFVVRSTKVDSSFMQTWSSGKRSSQIDHILTHRHSFLYLKRMRCTKPGDIKTDHKVLIFNVVENRSAIKTPFIKTPAPPRLDVDHTLLQHRTVQKRYAKYLNDLGSIRDQSNDVEASWKQLKEKLHLAIAAVLKRSTRLPSSRDCRLALASVKKCMFWVQRSYQPKWAYKLAEARTELKKQIRVEEENEIMDFFENLHRFPVGQRIRQTYKYLKRFKKKTNSAAISNKIKLSDWIQEDFDESMIPTCSDDPLASPIVDPPTLGEIAQILAKMKNGKAPGVDNLYSEYFKYCDSITLEEIHQLLVKVFTSNELPEEWKKVVMVPIPKVKQPKSIDDYRRICLTCTAYKVYASWILNRLQSFVGPIGNHQAAFLPGRSTTDHLHVLQRMLQENWNEGRPLILMSLDIEKAFDRVSLLSLPAILEGKGVPQYLIDRVIECLQGEQQQVLWQRQLTRPVLRMRGIKQGCPLSPYLFNLMMEAVLESVEDEVAGLRLNQEGYLTLPLILVFADDVIILAETVEEVELIITKLKEYLGYVGLNLNEDKCKVLVREPNAEAVDELDVLGKKYKATEPLRYLGVYLTARLERPMTIRTRCRTHFTDGP